MLIKIQQGRLVNFNEIKEIEIIYGFEYKDNAKKVTGYTATLYLKLKKELIPLFTIKGISEKYIKAMAQKAFIKIEEAFQNARPDSIILDLSATIEILKEWARSHTTYIDSAMNC